MSRMTRQPCGRLVAWQSALMTSSTAWAVAILSYLLPLWIRGEEIEIERDSRYLALMLFTAFFLGQIIGAFVGQRGISIRTWLGSSFTAILVSVAVPFTAFREVSVTHINHQRELVAWLSPAAYVLVWFTVFTRSKEFRRGPTEDGQTPEDEAPV